MDMATVRNELMEQIAYNIHEILKATDFIWWFNWVLKILRKKLKSNLF